MRRVAEELGVGTMTLYYYVRTKDDLLALMDDALMGEMLVPADELPPATGARRSRAIARARATRSPPSVGRCTMRARRSGPNGMRHLEQSMAAVATLPLDRRKMEVISIVDDFVFGHALRAPRSPAPRSPATAADRTGCGT